MVHGPWSMVHGPWSMVHRSMMDGILWIVLAGIVRIEVSRVDLTDLPPRGDHHVTIRYSALFHVKPAFPPKDG